MTHSGTAHRRKARFTVERLEDRAVPALLTYANDNWVLIQDTDSSGTLTNGDLVRNNLDTIGAGTVTGTYGTDAFGTVTNTAVVGVNLGTGSVAGSATITDALGKTDAGGVANVLQGTYTEDVTVPAGITLTGNGTITAAGAVTGTVTVSGTAIINAGGVGTPGTLTAAALTVATNGVVVADVNGATAGTYDQLSAAAVSVNGAFLAVQANATIPVGSVLTVINNTGANPVTGTFNGLIEGATVVASNGQTFRISYVGGDGNDVTLTALTVQNVSLSVTNTDFQTTVFTGDQTTYKVTVTNNGLSTVTGAQVSDQVPAQLTNVTWTSTPTGGATGSAGSGTGSINETVNLPPGATITYLVTGTVSGAVRSQLTNTATVTAPNGAVDTNTADNTATDVDRVQPKQVPASQGHFVVGEPNGQVVIFNANGSVAQFFSPFAGIGYSGPVNVAVGDLTGDGVDDYVFSAVQGPWTGVISVYDGSNFSLIGATFVFGAGQGVNMAIGDIDGDGVNDLVLATANGGSRVVAFNIVTRTQVAGFDVLPGFTGGLTLAVGDVNGDGVSDIVVGLASVLPAVGVFDSSGNLLGGFLAYSFPYNGGVNVAVGDLFDDPSDNSDDGMAEILVGPRGGGTFGSLAIFQFGNSTPVRSGAIPLYGPDRGIRVQIRDIDGNGNPDIVFAPGNGPGFGTRVLAVDFVTGNLIRDFDLFPALNGAVAIY